MHCDDKWLDVRTLLVAAAIVSASGCLCEHVVTVKSDDVTRLTVCVEVSETPDERLTGLRAHAPLAVHEGMLLVFPREDEVCLTNEGVQFTIDALFIDDEGTVTSGATLERDDATSVCAPRTRWVLEVAEGVARDVMPGDAVTRSDSAGAR